MDSNFLESIISAKRSVILNAPLREGKNVSVSKSIIEALKGKVSVTVLYSGNSQATTEIVNPTYDTVCERLLLTSQENLEPIWLVFPEYLAQFSEIKDSVSRPELQDFVDRLSYIASCGSEVNANLLLVSQSLLVSDLGFSNPVKSWFDIRTLSGE